MKVFFGINGRGDGRHTIRELKKRGTSHRQPCIPDAFGATFHVGDYSVDLAHCLAKGILLDLSFVGG